MESKALALDEYKKLKKTLKVPSRIICDGVQSFSFGLKQKTPKKSQGSL
jgi:hypothetical protein